jgi:hypothetical protein
MTLDAQDRLGLRRSVDPWSEELVRKAEETLSDAQMEKLGYPGRLSLSLNQVNNLLGVALETDSPAVVINWIRYQMGRGETESVAGWRNSGLGDAVVKAMEDLLDQAKSVAQQAFGDQSAVHVRQAHILLVRRYTGYLKRWFVAKAGRRKGGR